MVKITTQDSCESLASEMLKTYATIDSSSCVVTKAWDNNSYLADYAFTYDANNAIYQYEFKNMKGVKCVYMIPEIVDIEYNKWKCKLTFADGTSTSCKLNKNDENIATLEGGITTCLAKKLVMDRGYSNFSAVFNNIVNKAAKKYYKDIEDKAREKEEEEIAKKRAEKKRKKYEEYKARKAAKEHNRAVQIQYEAIMKALNDFSGAPEWEEMAKEIIKK